MDWLNYHHLYYFWVTAREGGLTKGAAKLRLTHSTLSTQLHALEECLGGELFQRQGRVLVLSPFGVEIARYADDIFKAGSELLEMARGNSTKLRSVLRVGVAPALPKTLVMPGFKTEPGGPPFMPETDGRSVPNSALVDTLRNNQRNAAASDAETRPILQAIPRPPEGPPAPVVGNNAKTLVMDSAGPREKTGHTPTPRLIDKLAVRVRPPSSAPELAPSSGLERFAIVRWLIGHLRRLFPSLFR